MTRLQPAAPGRAAETATGSTTELTLLAERCAHQRLVQSTCRACADHCPQRAWTLDEVGLHLDPELCDRCGQCVAACPLEALALAEPLPLVIDTAGAQRVMALACSRVGDDSQTRAAGRTVCLHGLNPEWLLQQRRAYGAHVIELASADCRRCTRAPASPDLQQRWTAVARRMRGRAPQLRWIDAEQWAERTRRHQAPDVARRRFFGSLLTGPASTRSHPSTGVAAAHVTSQRRALVLRLRQEGTPEPLWSARLDADRCTGCLACARVCPEQAITHHQEPVPGAPSAATSALLSLARNCTGCGLCETVCEGNAIHVHQPSDPPTTPEGSVVHLASCVCKACGQPYRLPVQQAGSRASGVCPTCQRGRLLQRHRIVQAP